jgi:predicted RNase H-like HicB family nuclease
MSPLPFGERIRVRGAAVPGCVSQGKTEAEALENIREAIAACLEVRREEGLPLTVETRTVEIPT